MKVNRDGYIEKLEAQCEKLLTLAALEGALHKVALRGPVKATQEGK